MTSSFWNLVAVGLPTLVFIVGLILLPGGAVHDYNARMGTAVLLLLAMGIASVLGLIAAVVALARGEARVWLSIIGLIVNLLISFPIASVLLRR